MSEVGRNTMTGVLTANVNIVYNTIMHARQVLLVRNRDGVWQSKFLGLDFLGF